MRTLVTLILVAALVVMARADDLTNAQQHWLMMPENHICPPREERERCAPVIARLSGTADILRCAMSDHENETMKAMGDCIERLQSEPARRADCFWALTDKTIHESGNYPRRYGTLPQVVEPEIDRAAAWRNLTGEERRKCEIVAAMTRDALIMRRAGVPGAEAQVRIFNGPHMIEMADRDRPMFALDVGLAVNVAYDRKACPDLDACVEETRLRCATGKQIEKDAAAGKLAGPRAVAEGVTEMAHQRRATAADTPSAEAPEPSEKHSSLRRTNENATDRADCRSYARFAHASMMNRDHGVTFERTMSGLERLARESQRDGEYNRQADQDLRALVNVVYGCPEVPSREGCTPRAIRRAIFLGCMRRWAYDSRDRECSLIPWHKIVSVLEEIQRKHGPCSELIDGNGTVLWCEHDVRLALGETQNDCRRARLALEEFLKANNACKVKPGQVRCEDNFPYTPWRRESAYAVSSRSRQG